MVTRLAASVAALAVAVLAVAACGHAGSADSAATVARVSAVGRPAAGGPVVGARAFGGHGRLAFVSGRRLYVLDGGAAGKSAVLHAVSTGKVPGKATGSPGSPAWSADGRWLAFLVGEPSADGAVTSGALWLAGPDGQGAHQVVPKVDGFAWSPKTDEIAATSGYGGKLFAVQPGRPIYPMLEVDGLFDGAPAWSPNGRELAVAIVNVNAKGRLAKSAIDLFVPTEGILVSSLASARTDALIIDGWWTNGEGLLAWSDPKDSASLAAGALPLVSYPLDGKSATLASTLVGPSFAVPSALYGVTLVTGGGRSLGIGETIKGCAVSGKCSRELAPGPPPLGLGPAPVNLDPAWAPGAFTAQAPVIAFVHGAQEPTAGLSQQDLEAWYRTRILCYNIVTGGNSLPVTRAGTGVAAPTWSANSQDILYVRDNALWLIPLFTSGGALSSTAAFPVVSKLFAGNWPNSNGYTAWQSQFAWFS